MGGESSPGNHCFTCLLMKELWVDRSWVQVAEGKTQKTEIIKIKPGSFGEN